MTFNLDQFCPGRSARGSLIASIVAVLCLHLGHDAHAWGDTAHLIICEIAFQELNVQARAGVKRLIRLDPEFSRFSKSCTWADHPRKRNKEHYVNLSRSDIRIGNDPCPVADKCVLTAIEDDLAIISKSSSSDAKKLKALKYLSHWVGDIHQPLHVAFRDDYGGSLIKETGPCSRNLHQVWDRCIVEKYLGKDIRNTVLSLRSTVTKAERSLWIRTDPKDWANESFNITVSEEVGYCFQKEGACWYGPDNRELDPNEVRRVMNVDDAYIQRQLPTVKKRLTQAGIRLGNLLNRALGGLSKGEITQTFSIKNLVARLRETGAIGLFTKLELKNQIEDLFGEFRKFHDKASDTQLTVLKDRFNLLLMKVLTLLQDDDPLLFQDIVEAREFLWTNLADPAKFAQL